jgi:hypothetical protein
MDRQDCCIDLELLFCGTNDVVVANYRERVGYGIFRIRFLEPKEARICGDVVHMVRRTRRRARG